jgi:hypothetical protein
MDENFNNIGGDFDDLFDESSAVTVENPVNESQEKAFEIPDMDDMYGVVEESDENDDSESSDDSESQDSDLDVWHQYLRDLGVSDSKAIQFENEDGEIETVDFDTLDRDTQLTMLRELTDPGLSNHEIEVVNYLRRNNASFDEVVNYFAEQRLQQYFAQNPDQMPQRVYSIDEYTNDELYLADLKNKYPDFTEEELLAELDSAKLNEELFNKKSDTIRQQYKEYEDRMQQEAVMAEQQRYEALQQNIVNAVLNFKEISIDPDPESEDWRGLEIEDGDRQNILSYLLDQDQEGKSRLVRDIEDPNELIKLSWYKLYGDETFKHITGYWKGLLKEARQENAKLSKQIEKYRKETNTVVTPTSGKKSKSSNNKGFSLGEGWDDYLD